MGVGGNHMGKVRKGDAYVHRKKQRKKEFRVGKKEVKNE